MGKAIIYATGLTKHTKQLADYMAKEIKADIFNLKQMTKINVTDYDSVIFGTGVSAGKAYKPVAEFLEANKDALSGKKLYLFIDCKVNADKEEALRDKIAGELGIVDAVVINSKDCEMNEAEIPASVDEFLARL